MKNPWERTRLTSARMVETAVAFCGLGFAFYVNWLAGKLCDAQGEYARPSPDILLSILPVVDLRLLFLWGFTLFLVAAFGLSWIYERQRAAHILWLYTILILVRCFFLILTPMHLPQGALLLEPGDTLNDLIGKYMHFKHDLFFSAHTAMPFMAYLIFRVPWVRYFFLSLSIVLATTVLLTRLHYSIDVFAAFFITYAVYRWERRWLRRPYRRVRHIIYIGIQKSLSRRRA